MLLWSHHTIFYYLAATEADGYDRAGPDIRASPLLPAAPEGFTNSKFGMFHLK